MMKTKWKQMPEDCIFELKKIFKTQCCDCGLVHIWEFKEIRKYIFGFRVWRDDAATKRIRKSRKYKI
jgi:hypothetical protein